MTILTTQNAKTNKGEPLGYLTGILYLAPVSIAGVGNVCPNASAGCSGACLYTAGRGRFTSIQQARIAKTLRFFKDRTGFMHDLFASIEATIRKARREGLTPCVRLNGTSDLPWERITFAGQTAMQAFPDVQFYDYTKSPQRMTNWCDGNMPSNYHLTFSRSESNADIAHSILKSGGNVAAVLRVRRSEEMPMFVRGVNTVDGDKHDLRFLDPRPVIVGLRAKGDAIRDTSGFVMDAA